jgi:hypothetical protein
MRANLRPVEAAPIIINRKVRCSCRPERGGGNAVAQADAAARPGKIQ